MKKLIITGAAILVSTVAFSTTSVFAARNTQAGSTVQTEACISEECTNNSICDGSGIGCSNDSDSHYDNCICDGTGSRTGNGACNGTGNNHGMRKGNCQ